ncbi:MAG: D-tyrosyl-tRNA(Tyr) deacylase [Desulfobacteraceae bacterium]|nr:D-tyrosyl-tRNA(Tyr) deacylase [Desulfobacteraceae bacterium]
MKAVIQRVSKASVKVEQTIVGNIKTGLVVLLGIGHNDTEKDAGYLADKIINLRIFEDDNGKMNKSLLNVKGDLLVISQFTLMGDCRKGRRPSFIKAAPPEMANRLYQYFVNQTKTKGVKTETGKFQALMDVSLVNNGPVTISLDTEA